MFQEEILEETNHFFEKQQVVNENENMTSDEDEPMDVDTIIETLQASKTLDNVYAKSLILDGELSSAEMQAAVFNNYGKIQSAFINFRNIKKTVLTTKSVY